MSAFMCPDEVFAQVARFLKEDRPDVLGMIHADLELDPVGFVEILRLLNVQSIRHCYPSEIGKPWMTKGALDEPIDPLSVVPCSAAQAAHHLDCIDYQACETPRWKASGVQALVSKIADEIGGTRRDDPRYGPGKGRRMSQREDSTGHVCDLGGFRLEWGHASGPAPAPPPPMPTGWKEGERNAKVMRKETLRKLAVDGRLAVVDSYSYDGRDVHQHEGAPKPVKFHATHGESYTTGTWALHEHQLSPAKQWTNATGHYVHLHVHSNYFLTFVVVDAVAPKARAA